jgi:hypothetical protein
MGVPALAQAVVGVDRWFGARHVGPARDQRPGQVRHGEDRRGPDLRVVVHARQTGTVSVLIDTPVWHWRGRLWSHLVSDVSYEELHAFVAAELGIPRRAFQGDHYDIPEDLYDVAVAAGAQPVGARELLSRLLAAGLRVRKQRAS